MANLSNINNFFVVEQTTGYVGIGITDPAFPLEVKSASAELALNATGGSIYRLKSDSTDYFRINKNGVGDRLVISGGGDVGIGTATPDTLLNLEGAVNTSIITLGCTKNDSSWSGERIGGINFYSADGSGPGASVRGSINYIATSSSGGDTAMNFATGDNSTAMTIDNDGNVGIGTPTPQTGLELVGADNTAAKLTLTNTAPSPDNSWSLNPEYNSHNFTFSEDSTARVTFKAGGNVGINSTNPQTKFVVQHTDGGTGIEFSMGATLSYLQCYNRTTNDYIGLKIDGEDIRFGTNDGSERMRINSAGNVGIGTTSPSGAGFSGTATPVLEVSGTKPVIKVTETDVTNSYIYMGSSGGNSYIGSVGGALFFQTGAATTVNKIAIDAAGCIYNVNTQGSTWFGQDAGLSQIGTTGSYNTLYGFNAGKLITTGARNTIIGGFAGDASGTNTMNYNVVIGSYAGSALVNTSNSNVLVGDGAGSSSIGMSGNVIIGQGAGDGNTGASNVFIGYNAAPVNTSGQRNVAIGNEATRYNITGIDVVAIGYRALYNDASIEESTAVGSQALYTQTSGRNTAIGYHALQDLTTGTYNTAVGGETAENITDGNYNVAVGTFSLRALTEGDENTAVGYQALANNTTQSKLTALGYRAGYFWTGGNENTFIGYNAGYGSAAGSTGGENTMIGSYTGGSSAGIGGNGNTSLGRYTLFSLTSGSYNTALGHQAGASISTGDYNTVVGKNAGNVIGGGDYNTLVGAGAGIKITSGQKNTVLGYEAMYNLVTLSNNTAVGYQALYSTTTDGNTAFGYHAGLSTTIGGSNTFIGQQCHALNQTGYGNTSMGMQAAYNGTAGIQNTYIGYAAGYGQTGTGGNYNTCVGFYASKTIGAGNEHNTTMGYYAGGGQGSGVFSGDANTTIGSYCGTILTSGNQNTFVGQSAGSNVTTGSNNTCLGYDADTPSNSSTNTIVLGNSSVSSLQCQVQTISALSDERDKTNIKDSNYGLDLINSLKPVTFEWNQRDGNRKGKKDLGFIAQDLQKVNDEHLDLINDENPEKLLASYSRLIPVLVKSIQELKAEIEILKSK